MVYGNKHVLPGLSITGVRTIYYSTTFVEMQANPLDFTPLCTYMKSDKWLLARWVKM